MFNWFWKLLYWYRYDICDSMSIVEHKKEWCQDNLKRGSWKILVEDSGKYFKDWNVPQYVYYFRSKADMMAFKLMGFDD